MRLDRPFRLGTIARRFAIAAAILAASAAAAQDYPKLKAGQWDITLDRQARRPMARQPMKTTMCTDDAVQRDMMHDGRRHDAR